MKTNFDEMLASAEEVLECQRVLANTNDNVVSDLLRFSDKEFIEWGHYPEDDVKDSTSGSQYYYHAHQSPNRSFKEHGHFHIFMKNYDKNNPDTLPLTHLIAISMNEFGAPQALFTVNHWITGGVWEDAPTVISFLDKFIIDHAKPSWAVNRWINAIVKLYKPQIIELVKQRDQEIKKLKETYQNQDIFELREIEILSYLPISIESKLLELQELEKLGKIS